ncbi:MAG: hypothetical protein H8D55_00270 [Deltaproteobacteria bacterium]|nr:hypothetical protein [Deltaproteobacteria bacterium]
MERFFNLDSFINQTAFYAKDILLLIGFEVLLKTDFFGYQIEKIRFRVKRRKSQTIWL